MPVVAPAVEEVPTVGGVLGRGLNLEGHVYLPSSIAAHPGRLRLWPHQREIADSIGNPAVERVSVRVGYTQLLTAAIGHYAVNDPSPILVVVPAEQDARDLMVGNIEPTFAESPVLRAALAADDGGRDTLFQRRFPGGSLKLVSARAPRNLRGHTARVLLLDEVDGFEISAGGEGDPVTLAERRTLSYGDRKIVMGSTPVDEATSRILRAYEASDRRVFECACPECGALSELSWGMDSIVARVAAGEAVTLTAELRHRKGASGLSWAFRVSEPEADTDLARAARRVRAETRAAGHELRASIVLPVSDLIEPFLSGGV